MCNKKCNNCSHFGGCDNHSEVFTIIAKFAYVIAIFGVLIAIVGIYINL